MLIDLFIDKVPFETVALFNLMVPLFTPFTMSCSVNLLVWPLASFNMYAPSFSDTLHIFPLAPIPLNKIAEPVEKLDPAKEAFFIADSSTWK